MDAPEVKLSPFEEGWGPQVRSLICGIQQEEFQIPIRAEDQPDLFAIPQVYRRHGGEFWVARDGERVVGTIALFVLEQARPAATVPVREAALRKMFVAPSHRGTPHRVAQRLLDALLAHARIQGFAAVSLGTTAAFHAAHRFYEKNGFVEISRDALPEAWPHNAVDVKFYRRAL